MKVIIATVHQCQAQEVTIMALDQYQAREASTMAQDLCLDLEVLTAVPALFLLLAITIQAKVKCQCLLILVKSTHQPMTNQIATKINREIHAMIQVQPIASASVNANALKQVQELVAEFRENQRPFLPKDTITSASMSKTMQFTFTFYKTSRYLKLTG